MITYMYNNKDRSEDWNKVVIIPVTLTTNSSGQVLKVVHDMSLTSTRLVGGSENKNGDIKLEVVYSRFRH